MDLDSWMFMSEYDPCELYVVWENDPYGVQASDDFIFLGHAGPTEPPFVTPPEACSCHHHLDKHCDIHP